MRTMECSSKTPLFLPFCTGGQEHRKSQERRKQLFHENTFLSFALVIKGCARPLCGGARKHVDGSGSRECLSGVATDPDKKTHLSFFQGQMRKHLRYHLVWRETRPLCRMPTHPPPFHAGSASCDTRRSPGALGASFSALCPSPGSSFGLSAPTPQFRPPALAFQHALRGPFASSLSAGFQPSPALWERASGVISASTVYCSMARMRRFVKRRHCTNDVFRGTGAPLAFLQFVHAMDKSPCYNEPAMSRSRAGKGARG